MKNYPIVAAQLYTVRDFMQSDEQFAETIDKVKKIGYTAVQLSGHTNVSVDCITETVKAAGIKVCITHIAFDRFINDFDNVVKEHQAWGCNVIGIGGMPGKYTESKDGIVEFVKQANSIGDKLSKYEMKFAYHNHSHEFIKYDGKTGMDIIIENAGDNFEFIPDVYWLQNAGVNPYTWLYKVKGKVSTIHYKDMGVLKGNSQTMTEVGYGNMDYKLMTEVCTDIGVKFCAVEQDVCPGDPFVSLKKSYDYLASIGLK
ncbi:MAG: sugar phosphate isomerase/epimerase [Clostridia bacterium]|jgi:sugar phosphate isomerase/epimerase|nr:sugar phosphate isomerase/epimerase [Clostridia bacterium]